MTRRDSERGAPGGVDPPEERLERARRAFDQELREASETGARAARRLLVPALWGAALVGGTLLAIAMFRLVRRPSTGPTLLRVSIEPRFASRSLLPMIGGAVARLAVQRLVGAASSRGAEPSQHNSIAPEATPTLAPRNGARHVNGSSRKGPAEA